MGEAFPVAARTANHRREAPVQVTLAAAPRVINGTEYPDPIAFVVAGGFAKEEPRAVINAYKAYYAKGSPGGDWVAYVTANTSVQDPDRARAIMCRYRKFYGK